MSRKTNLIVIHCSDSPNGRTLFTGKHGQPGFVTPVQEIDNWHAARGFKRTPEWRASQNPELTSIGYHFVIYVSGAVATGRHPDEVGAHVSGYNANSIGICLVGCDQFSQEQWDTLRDHLCGLAKSLEQQAPNSPRRFNNPTPAEAIAIFAKLGVRVVGHTELNPDKTCPNLDAQAWLAGDMKPLEGQVFIHGGTDEAG